MSRLRKTFQLQFQPQLSPKIHVQQARAIRVPRVRQTFQVETVSGNPLPHQTRSDASGEKKLI